MSAPDEDTLRRLLAGLRHGPVHITGGRCDGDSRAVNAFVELIRLTPALAAEVLRTQSERLTVGNLLAVIHRDGGHHMAEHGVDASCAAAERVVCDERARLDAVEHAARAYRDATDVLIGAWAVRDGTSTEHWIKAELSRVEAAEAQAKARTELDRVLGGGR